MNTVVVGLQWGDEGKGKIIDMLMGQADVVVRSQGGSNAGHTVIAEGEKYVLHLLPSGILWKGKTCVIGNGVVIDPKGLIGELEGLSKKGRDVSPESLIISERAHVTLPYHRELDAAREMALGKGAIGTTRRGIGPTYSDKATRNGLRLIDFEDVELALEIITSRLEGANEILARFGLQTFEPNAVFDEVYPYIQKLLTYSQDAAIFMHEAWKRGDEILFEGAQGTFLDLDFGTYPFVTSSSTIAGGGATGSGLPPTAIERVVGVCKAYTTRVGAGPFPTRDEEFANYLHGLGREFGATTGRARGCGWLDGVLIRYACMLSGVTDLAVTNLDGLDKYKSIKVCTAYEIHGERFSYPPAQRNFWDEIVPIYEEFPGWEKNTTGCKEFEDLPKEAQSYLRVIGEFAGAPVMYVGVGPDREQTITCK